MNAIAVSVPSKNPPRSKKQTNRDTTSPKPTNVQTVKVDLTISKSKQSLPYTDTSTRKRDRIGNNDSS